MTKKNVPESNYLNGGKRSEKLLLKLLQTDAIVWGK